MLTTPFLAPTNRVAWRRVAQSQGYKSSANQIDASCVICYPSGSVDSTECRSKNKSYSISLYTLYHSYLLYYYRWMRRGNVFGHVRLCLIYKSLDLETSFSVSRYIFRISRSRSHIDIIGQGQGHRSNKVKLA